MPDVPEMKTARILGIRLLTGKVSVGKKYTKIVKSRLIMIYGHDKTIHETQHLHVETDKQGKVVAVWFRCAMVPFEQVTVGEDRAVQMEAAYKRGISRHKLNAIDIEVET